MRGTRWTLTLLRRRPDPQGGPDPQGPEQTTAAAAGTLDERHAAVRQYSLAQILEVWGAAAIPMAFPGSPSLLHRLGVTSLRSQALLICLTLGLVWQFVLVMILMRRELGGTAMAGAQATLWLRPPRDPRTGDAGGKVWWWAVLFTFLGAVWALVPGIPGPGTRTSPTS